MFGFLKHKPEYELTQSQKRRALNLLAGTVALGLTLTGAVAGLAYSAHSSEIDAQNKIAAAVSIQADANTNNTDSDAAADSSSTATRSPESASTTKTPSSTPAATSATPSNTPTATVPTSVPATTNVPARTTAPAVTTAPAPAVVSTVPDKNETTDSSGIPSGGDWDNLAGLINAERQKAGMKPLTYSKKLEETAIKCAVSNAKAGYLDHNLSGCGYEDLAMYPGKFPSGQAIVNMWMNSPGHKAAILATHTSTIAIGWGYKNGYSYVAAAFNTY